LVKFVVISIPRTSTSTSTTLPTVYLMLRICYFEFALSGSLSQGRRVYRTSYPVSLELFLVYSLQYYSTLVVLYLVLSTPRPALLESYVPASTAPRRAMLEETSLLSRAMLRTTDFTTVASFGSGFWLFASLSRERESRGLVLLVSMAQATHSFTQPG
jgi:hypothetical protein